MNNPSDLHVTAETGDALIVVDVQNDFLPGGALGVKEGDKIIAPVNQVIRVFLTQKLPILYSRDWHPADHSSFARNGGPWPPHCVQGTEGATFSPALKMPPDPLIFSKGTHVEKEEYSAFQGRDSTGRSMAEALSKFGVKRVLIGGLATDYCVLNTVQDLLKAGFRVIVLTDACRAVDVSPGDGENALVEMIAEGATIATAKAVG
ncbi:MAG: nicotinamidase [Deltaproteobacteria bacterium]|nr:nicotinamidase [Deltaproteobacteria bacterium]